MKSARTMRRRLRRLVATFFLLVSLCGTTALAQGPIWSETGVAGADLFGTAVANAGDVNGDGIDDLVVGAALDDLGGTNAGLARVYSGADLSLLHEFVGGLFDRLGSAVAGAGDVNGDGFDDVIVAGQGNGLEDEPGFALVFSGLDGSTLLLLVGASDTERFGTSVAGAGDVNGDGLDDLIVGAPGYQPPPGFGLNTGRAVVISGADGSGLFGVVGDQAGDLMGQSVAGVGDLDLDGFDDVAVGARGHDLGPDNAGLVRVRAGPIGAPLFDVPGLAVGDGLGASLAAAGDVDGDTVPDLVVGAAQGLGPLADGYALVLSGDGGSTIHTLVGNGGAFATSVSAVDADLDGVPDLVVGAPFDDPPGLVNAGFVWVFSGVDASVLHKVPGDRPNDQFGWASAGLGDINGDGAAEIVAGAPQNYTPNTPPGYASVVVALPGPWTNLGNGLAGTAGVPVLNGVGTMLPRTPITLQLSQALSAADVALIIGFSNLSAPFKGGTLVPFPDVVVRGLSVGADGTLALTDTWPPGVPPGATILFQHWIQDAAGPQGFSASLAVQGVSP